MRFPYLVVRILPAVYRIKPLPQNLGRDALTDLGWKEFHANEGRFRVSVVFGPRDCRYLEPDGTATASRKPPSGGSRVTRP